MQAVTKALREDGKLKNETAEAIVIAITKTVDDRAASRSDLAEAVNKIERALLAAQAAMQKDIQDARLATQNDVNASKMTVLYWVVGLFVGSFLTNSLGGVVEALLKKLLHLQ